MNGESVGMGDFRRSWMLWTVWSSELGPLMDCEQYSTKEFALEILAIVQEKDEDLQFSEDEDIRVIRPTGLLEMKEDTGTGVVRVEIGGTVFRPGTRNSEEGLGPRWRLFASNDLSTVLRADKNLNLVKLRKEIFVIVNGRIVESERRIWMDENDRQTKIIRIIEKKIQPGTDDRYLSVSYKFRNYWKYRGCPKYSVLQVVPYAALRSSLARTPEKKGRKRCLTPVENGNDSIPAKALAPLLHVRAASVPIQDEEMDEGKESNNSDHNHNVNGGSKGRGSSSYRIDETDSDDDVQMIEDEERPVVNVDASKKPAPASRREKSPPRKQYSKLSELEEELSLLCSCTKTKANFTKLLKNKNVYGIVEEVIQTPSDVVGMSSKTKMYVLRISDETKSNVLVRLCTAKQSAHSRPTILNEVGPPMSAGDIIRIHRATVQFEVFESGVREMVISTSTHLNYVIFINVLDVIDAPVEHKRLALGTEVLKDGDEDLIRDLRRFAAVRIVQSASSENLECSSDNELFHDTQTNFSSDESLKEVQKQQVEALDKGRMDYKDVLNQEILPSSEEIVVVVPGDESSSENEMLSQGGQDSSQIMAASGSPVQSKTMEESIKPAEQDDLLLTISSVSDLEVATGQHFVLEAKICQMETFFDEDTTVVTVDDGTKPTLNFETLIDVSELDQHGNTAVDVVIRNISRNLKLQRTLEVIVQTDRRVVLPAVRVQKRHSDGTSPSYLLYIDSEIH